ncbi:ATP-dependent RNA helicase RhlB [Permianibacter sp. IMCC34836]|uniref:ATP-dependent RNA helicase RhlB n=1 Tax=Permianibacter fluminis TaxID=2738515 RepID=UPI001557E267|nr:ATP-dependent RNA helicase RhlB [Permianibacter fluminis]NQD35711.1 ATP-dependent RNA helicase RhlB [Permianibacter fluminis]
MSTHLTDIHFSSLGLHPALLKALDDMGYDRCTPIQAATLPKLLAGHDIAGQAQTGTGKTAAFLLATFNDLLTLPEIQGRRRNEPRALIMAPTRELAIQIYNDGLKLAAQTELRLTVVYGGAGYEEQRKSIENGVDVLIGTTGRLIDYYKQGVYGLEAIDVVVLDEADRMFDLGFIADIRYLLRKMPPPADRLNMLFSATLSQRVLELGYEHMNDAEHIQVERDLVAAGNIREMLYYPSNEERIPLLLGLFDTLTPDRAIVFTNTRRAGEEVWAYLAAYGLNAGLLTGDVPQKKRIALLDELKDGKLAVLVCTDVAGRGLHIEGVSHVFNYDLPDDPEDYVHRIGRTARAGAEGDAISFASEETAINLPAIENYIEHKLPTSAITADLLREPVSPQHMIRMSPAHRENKPHRRGGPRGARPSGSRHGRR